MENFSKKCIHSLVLSCDDFWGDLLCGQCPIESLNDLPRRYWISRKPDSYWFGRGLLFCTWAYYTLKFLHCHLYGDIDDFVLYVNEEQVGKLLRRNFANYVQRWHSIKEFLTELSPILAKQVHPLDKIVYRSITIIKKIRRRH
ncbi:MAG: hypothetical protein JSV12_00340 [Candidatus Bathyarchaeota archaeon]|nr:MAG: hypothetical protein JSV12_00340 [Candidatus Bathyarchaeota archaeon]